MIADLVAYGRTRREAREYYRIDRITIKKVCKTRLSHVRLSVYSKIALSTELRNLRAFLK